MASKWQAPFAGSSFFPTQITAIDKQTRIVTIEGPAGNQMNVQAYDEKNLGKLKVGDLVTMTVTRAMAVAVNRP